MDNTDGIHIKRRRRPIGIKWKMFAILICFVSLFAFALWVFQVQMLNFFYQNAKFTELENTAEVISGVLGNDDTVSGVAQVYSKEYYNDIWVYRVGSSGVDFSYPIVYADGSNDGYGPFLEINFKPLYEKAIANDGTYIVMVPMKNFKESYFEFKIIKDNADEPRQYPFVSGNTRQISAIYTSVYQRGGESYFVVQRASISPVGTMVHTLENQVLFVGTLLILFALVLAILMSKLITKPIVQISKSAKRLAVGKYDAEFSGRGYREIEELSETLNYAARELSKNDNLQKELISNISHDLRTPLTMIKGYGEVIRDIPEENTSENIQVIIDETSRLAELVNDMLDLSRIQSGTRVPQMKTFCITEVIRATMFRYEKLTMQEGYKIDFVADSDVLICADNGMILQVVYNLINNAINYTGPDKYVSVLQTVSNDTVRISVTDTGSGISQDDVPFIWDRYYKVDKVHKRATVGTGLGLSIVKGILELHNATYGVTTTLNKGSTFWFEFKIVNSDEYKAEIVEL